MENGSAIQGRFKSYALFSKKANFANVIFKQIRESTKGCYDIFVCTAKKALMC